MYGDGEELLICLLRETEPDWDKDLAEDVKGECSSKYGQVAHIKVERDSDVSPRTHMLFEHVIFTFHRARSMCSSMQLILPRKL